MNSITALTIVCVIFALGDFISVKSKSILSTMLVALVLLLIGFWTKLPTSLFEDAGLLKLGGILVPFLIAHMGTLLNTADLVREWRTVVISLGAILGIALALIFIGIPLLGREYAISAAPPISGGVVAAIIMGEKAQSLGMNDIFLFTTLLVVIQQFFGIPLASVLLNREARNFLAKNKGKVLDLQVHSEELVAEPKKKLLPALPENLQTPYILLAKLGLVVVLALKISELTGLNLYILSLFFGLVFKEIGFLEDGILNRANSFGLGMVALMAVIFNSTSTASPEILKGLLFPLVTSLIIAIIGIIIVCIIVGKIFNYSMEMSISIGLSALFGFPGTFILPSEVANAVGKNKEERLLVLNHILPKMLVAGFVTVTIASVILAGIMIDML